MSELTCGGCKNRLEYPVILTCCSNTCCRQCLLDPSRVVQEKDDFFIENSPISEKETNEGELKCMFCDKIYTKEDIYNLPVNELIQALLKNGITENKPFSKLNLKSSIRKRYGLDSDSDQLQEETKEISKFDTYGSEDSSGEETKMIESGADKHMETISSTSSESVPLCQRCSSEDANVV